MQGSDVLTVIAEISVALVGFSGIVVALRQAGLDSWPDHERLRFRNMLEIATYSVLFSLLPFLPHHLGVSGETTWSFCSFSLAVGLGTYIGLTRVRMRAHVRQRLSAAWLHVYTWGTVAVCTLVLIGALGLLGRPQLGIYLVGLGWMLFMSLSVFMRLVLAPKNDGATTQ
jgi:hypothetical protein